MSYADFRPRKIWLSSEVQDGITTISVAPLPLAQLHTLMRYFRWTDHWALVFAIQKSEKKRFLRQLEEFCIAHTRLSDQHFLFAPGELEKLDADFWSIEIIPLPECPDEAGLEELSQLPYHEIHQCAFSKFKAPISLGIHMFDENAGLKIPEDSLVRQVWHYLLASHLVSLQVVSIEQVEQYAAQLPFRDLEGRHLLYWGYRSGTGGKVEFAYLQLARDTLPALPEWAVYHEHAKAYQSFLHRCHFPDVLPCLLLSENTCELVRFGEVRSSLREPIMPLFIHDHRNFGWGIIPRPQGVVFSMEPFRFRHYVDFLPLGADAPVFIHSVDVPFYDVHTHEPAPFWIGMPARESPIYFRHDDHLYHLGGRMEQEFHFALIDPGMTEDDVEATLGTSENVPWFSFSEFFGKEGSVPPMDRVGSVWDEHVSGIYLEQQEDIESLIAHTAWGLFRERFDHFPGQLPDSRFCAEMLGYLMGIDGRVQIEWTDFLQEDVAYHLCFTTRCKGPCEELPQEQRVCIRYCNGEWRLIR